MYHVYIIRSVTYPEQIYVGYTEDLHQRLTTHNAGGSPHTDKYRPWELTAYLSFKSKVKALEFEKYLKSSSGRTFKKKRLL